MNHQARLLYWLSVKVDHVGQPVLQKWLRTRRNSWEKAMPVFCISNERRGVVGHVGEGTYFSKSV